MNTPVREGETIEGSRTMRNRPYPVLKCSSGLREENVALETTPSDFRQNLRNHGSPLARPREKARNECEREPSLLQLIYDITCIYEREGTCGMTP